MIREALMIPLYNQVRRGLPGLGRPDAPAGGSAADAPSRHLFAGAATGMLMGLPGLFLMPVTVPIDLGVLTLVQLHAAASVAHAAGRDLGRRDVRDAVIDLVLDRGPIDGSSVGEEVDRTFVAKVTERMVRGAMELGGAVVQRRARRAAVRRLGRRAAPVLGGLLGAWRDHAAVRRVIREACETFAADSPVADRP